MPKSLFTDGYALMLAALVAARREAAMTQSELSERLGKPQPFISKVERGVRRIDVIEFYAIARALRRDPVELFGEIARKLPRQITI